MTQLDFSDHTPAYQPLMNDIRPHILEAFVEYHRANPEIYELFKRFANEVKVSGRRYYGAKAIMEKIRWEVNIERKGDFKCNDHYTSCYVRLLISEDPRFKDFFETRRAPWLAA